MKNYFSSLSTSIYLETEGSILLCHNTTAMNKWIPAFQGNIMPSYFKINRS